MFADKGEGEVTFSMELLDPEIRAVGVVDTDMDRYNEKKRRKKIEEEEEEEERGLSQFKERGKERRGERAKVLTPRSSVGRMEGLPFDFPDKVALIFIPFGARMLPCPKAIARGSRARRKVEKSDV